MPPTDQITDLRELEAPQASTRTFLTILALGIGFDLAFNGQYPGLSMPIFTVALSYALRSATKRSAETDALLVGAVTLSIFTALRASETLIALDVLAIAALLGLAVTQDAGRLGTTSIVALLKRVVSLATRSLHVPRFLAAPLGRDVDRSTLRIVIRTAVIALPLLAVFASLLASGDRVFARMLSSILPEWSAAGVLSHIVLTFVGIAMVAVLWRSALGDRTVEPSTEDRQRRELLGFTEWATVLGGIDMLFAAFVLVQIRYLFGGDGRVAVTPGLTYAEYARSGFIQLALAAALTILVILAVWDAGTRATREQERWFRILVTAMVALTGVVLASALKRLALYEGTFGFTLNRFYGYVVIVSIGAVLLVLAASILARRRDRIVAGFLLVGLAALLTVNLLGPDRFVADRNVARFEATGKIDAAYLGRELSADAVPIAVDLLDRLTPMQAGELQDALCSQLVDLSPEPSWRSLNLGRAAARTALASARINPATCDREF
ncbi:MAG TPA: DUF4173 domain-containing protein [Actinomycetota bacterium]|nr:DUF4173 domain-containing protein [Actinomycetota bacterium]